MDVGIPPLRTEFEIKNAKHNSSTEECYVDECVNDRDNSQSMWIAPKVVVVVSNKFLILIHPKPILLGQLFFCPCSTPIRNRTWSWWWCCHSQKKEQEKNKKKKILVSVSPTTTCFFCSALLPSVWQFRQRIPKSSYSSVGTVANSLSCETNFLGFLSWVESFHLFVFFLEISCQ